MRKKFLPEAHLLEPVFTSEFAGRSCLHEHVVVIKVAGPPLDIILTRCLLFIDVRHTLFAEGAIVEPIVAHPAVDHGVHRHGNLERRVGIDERHQRQETAIELSRGMRISIRVYLTDKRAAARVVYIDPENPLHGGIELTEPRNIWGSTVAAR